MTVLEKDLARYNRFATLERQDTDMQSLTEYNGPMPWCERCELDDTMCAHSPAALQVAARERRRARPVRWPRDLHGFGPTSSNREWSGDPLSADDYLRAADHVKDARWQVDLTYDAYVGGCSDCLESGCCGLDFTAPEMDQLMTYSHLALGFAASLVFHDEVSHDHRPTLAAWLLTLQVQHASAGRRRSDQVDHEQMLFLRGQSAKPAVRWMGRSPRHNG